MSTGQLPSIEDLRKSRESSPKLPSMDELRESASTDPLKKKIQA